MIQHLMLSLTLTFSTLAIFFATGCSGTHDTCIDADKINPEQVCIQVYAPVCGCDGKTYGNECKAEAAGVTEWEEGACNN